MAVEKPNLVVGWFVLDVVNQRWKANNLTITVNPTSVFVTALSYPGGSTNNNNLFFRVERDNGGPPIIGYPLIGSSGTTVVFAASIGGVTQLPARWLKGIVFEGQEEGPFRAVL